MKRKPFQKPKPKPPKDPRHSSESTGVYKRPTEIEEERTETVRKLLGDIDLSLDEDRGTESDLRENARRSRS
jgi:hypothetical protein